MAKKLKIIWVSKSVLARHLKVTRQVVNNWALRGLIPSQYSDEIGQTLVAKTDKIPTNDKRNKAA